MFLAVIAQNGAGEYDVYFDTMPTIAVRDGLVFITDGETNVVMPEHTFLNVVITAQA